MENFDLRKYLAEGKLKVNEGDMDHLMQDLERELKQHDWFYYMADDNRSYVKGEDQQRELKRLLKMLNNSPEAVALYNKYAPVQDGIDLRIKEEKIEEAVELPKDIKWEFDDVIDQMDAYNATISLIGHSESTGKDYTASAEASKSGGGDDWDWMEVDEVEEETVSDAGLGEAIAKALKDKEANLKEWGSSDWHYFLDAMHTDLGKPTDAPDIFKVLDIAGDAVDKYWDDWEEYKTDYEGLKMDAAQTYLKTKFPEYFKGMQALFAPMNEEYNVGKGWEIDHDFDAMLDHALKLHAGTSIEDLKKVAHDFTDVNYHREVAYLEDAIDMLEAGKHEEFEDSLKLFKDEVKKTIRSFKESIKESLRAWNVIDIDGNVTHEGLSYEEALAKAKEVEGHKIRPTNMMLNENITQQDIDDIEASGNIDIAYKKAMKLLTSMLTKNITQQDIDDIEASGNIDIAYKKAMKLLTSMLTKNEVLDSYDPDQEQLDDEDEIFMPMDDEGRPLEEGHLVTFGYDLNRIEDVVKHLQSKYKEGQDFELHIGYGDDLPNAVTLKNPSLQKDYDLNDMLNAAQSDEDEIFMPMDDEGRPLEEALNPEVVKAVDRLIKALAKKYDYPERDAVFAIQAALKQRSFDNVNEDLDLGHQDDEPGMLKSDIYSIGKAAMELYQMVDEFDGEGEVDFPHWWQSKVIKAKDALQGAKHYLEFEMNEPAVDAMVTKDSLEEKDSFFTKDVKDAVISKLMDQLKK